MKTKEAATLSLIFTVHMLITVVPSPLDRLLDFVIPYVSAFIAFVFLENSKITLLCALPTTIRNYIALIKRYPLFFLVFEEKAPLVILYLIVSIPLSNMLEIFLAKFTVKKLKLKERVGYA